MPKFCLGTAYKQDCTPDGNMFIMKLCDKVLQYDSSSIFFITRYIVSMCNLWPGEVVLSKINFSGTPMITVYTH